MLVFMIGADADVCTAVVNVFMVVPLILSC